MNSRNTSWWAGIPVVFEFELSRAKTLASTAWRFGLALFPVAILTLVVITVNSSSRPQWSEVPEEFLQAVMFALVPMLISMLGTFLWTASAVSSELEGQSWIYLAVRPGGRIAVLVGKYAAAIAWVLPGAIASATLSVALVWVTGSSLVESGLVLRTWLALLGICCLAVPAYAAIYLLLGSIFTKRSMVICVAYTLVFELVISFVPALINKLTIQYRLRALFIEWAQIDVTQGASFATSDLFGSEPAWLHVVVLVLYTLALVTAAVWLVRRREYLVTASADVS